MSWPTARLADVAKISTGSTPKTDNAANWGSHIPFVTPGDLGKGAPIMSAERGLSLQGLGSAKMVPAGSTLVCCIGSLGKSGFAGVDLTVNQQINSVSFDPRRFDARFGYYACVRLAPELQKMAPATTVPIVNKSLFSSLFVSMPPLDEQRRIAAILDKADALRQKRKRAIALLDSLTSSAFIEMFANRSNYDIVQLSDVTNQITDGAHFTPTYVNEGVPFLRVTDIHSSSVDWSSVKYIPRAEHDDLIRRCHPEFGDILLSKNGTIGVPKIVDWTQEFSIFVSLALLKPMKDRISVGYLYSFLKSPLAEQQLRQQSKTGTVTNLHLVDIRKIKIPLPPMDIQQRWDKTAKRIAYSHKLLTSAAQCAESLFATLQHRAFSGQL